MREKFKFLLRIQTNIEFIFVRFFNQSMQMITIMLMLLLKPSAWYIIETKRKNGKRT